MRVLPPPLRLERPVGSLEPPTEHNAPSPALRVSCGGTLYHNAPASRLGDGDTLGWLTGLEPAHCGSQPHVSTSSTLATISRQQKVPGGLPRACPERWSGYAESNRALWVGGPGTSH